MRVTFLSLQNKIKGQKFKSQATQFPIHIFCLGSWVTFNTLIRDLEFFKRPARRLTLSRLNPDMGSTLGQVDPKWYECPCTRPNTASTTALATVTFIVAINALQQEVIFRFKNHRESIDHHIYVNLYGHSSRLSSDCFIVVSPLFFAYKPDFLSFNRNCAIS
jgi:hypothetical protein